MNIAVQVIPRAKQRGFGMRPDGTLIVKVTEPPEGGRANAALIKALAKHFSVPTRRVRILHGHSSRTKVIDVLDA